MKWCGGGCGVLSFHHLSAPHIRILHLRKRVLIRLLVFKLWGHRAPAEGRWMIRGNNMGGNISETGGVLSGKMIKEKRKTNQKQDWIHQQKCLYQTLSYRSFIVRHLGFELASFSLRWSHWATQPALVTGRNHERVSLRETQWPVSSFLMLSCWI